jgi:hypothetical protein
MSHQSAWIQEANNLRAERDAIVAAMASALGAIDEALGMPQDGCNSTQRTLTAISLLHAAHHDDVQEIDRLREQLTEANARLAAIDALNELKHAVLEAVKP